jgi:hypothetical protein
MALTGDWAAWRSYHKQGHVRDAILTRNGTDAPHTGTDCAICRTVFTDLHPHLNVKPLTFARKVDGVWINLPTADAERRLRNYVREVHAFMTGVDVSTGEPTIAPVIAAEPEPMVQLPSDLTAEERELLRRLRNLRVFAADRDIDHISYRPIQDGRRMLRAGIPIDAIMHACTLHWDEADRAQAGIRDWDPEREFPGGRAAYMDALVEAGILIYLYGDAGYGKSYWAKDLARRRGVPYGTLPCQEGASIGWLLGRVDLEGFKGTDLLDMWDRDGEGGVFLFDEADGADSNMMLVMNGPLADDEGLLINPISRERMYRDPRKTILIFAGNTDGMGSDAKYCARNPFEFSLLDRIRMGRVHVGYDENVEMQVFMAA